MVSVIPLTSTIASSKFPRTMVIKHHTMNGLTDDSVALVFQVTVIDPAMIKSKRGCLNPAELNLAKSILRLHFEI